jgi:hypothetical protein
MKDWICMLGTLLMCVSTCTRSLHTWVSVVKVFSVLHVSQPRGRLLKSLRRWWARVRACNTGRTPLQDSSVHSFHTNCRPSSSASAQQG